MVIGVSAQDGSDFDGHRHIKIGAYVGIPSADGSDIHSFE